MTTELSRLSYLMNGIALRTIAVKRAASILELMSDTGYAEAAASIKLGHPEAEWQAKWWQDVMFIGRTLEREVKDLEKDREEAEGILLKLGRPQ